MPRQKSTTALLRQLRSYMLNDKYVKEPLNAYIVPSCDLHTNEYLAERDKRRDFISGFTGSAGTAIVTHGHACMWTDGRYHLQASQEMDSNWTLMKEGIPTTPSEGTWLSKNLPISSLVGVDPKTMPYNVWMPLQQQLEAWGHKLVPIATNLVDLMWTDRPGQVRNPLVPLALRFSGRSIRDKFTAVTAEMKQKNAAVLALTALDEIAWFLNLRGSDIDYNPVFFSFVLVFSDSFAVFVDPSQATQEVERHVRDEAGEIPFKMDRYSDVLEALKRAVDGTEGCVWFSHSAAYELVSSVPSKRLLLGELTPVALMKAIKNATEIEGMKRAHVKDAAALCCFFSWLEGAVRDGERVTEISAAERLIGFRAKQPDFVGPSFETISSVGPHGAIIHYRPTPDQQLPITSERLYLCDSGGQYRDGTTDVTRTLHFGTPTEHERECYTRVLKGQLKLAAAAFPCKVKGSRLDSFAREFLWEVGLDYAHGTGHGIGSYLNVHEGPIGVSFRAIPDDPGMHAGMFVSNEPGYYEDDGFGVRIEDIVLVVEREACRDGGAAHLAFETVTLVPKQTKLIKTELMTNKELEQLNEYHAAVRGIVGPVLEGMGESEAKAWLWKETEPIGCSVGDSAGQRC